MWKYSILFGTAFAVSACTTSAPEEPFFPEGAATSTFTFQDDSYLRGVKGSYNTVPRGRPAAILDVTYEIECLADNAQSRAARAKKLLDDAYVVAIHLYYDNPREHGWWRQDASKRVEPAGCIVTGLRYEPRTYDPQETLLYLVRNSGRTPLK
ncbi:hypothetical protein SAMN05444398_101125 [Roseovarius pacificus]|uniref:Lipoprotein n=1 Tax=Roseovarius pacificus TaxID=337701 RepID=A0A1M6WRT7_9RHOB|nr:hypothetical protein [Roseovarius pacificus]GGO52999.1 hypothetical protein GCM10011315_09870 [Roseovarius pacificus]SHK96472.1 hypothetical protein SAMN05444398_101125 [Roseovarius pacificus]